MIWVDRLVNKIKKRNLPHEWIDDAKTVSGRIHVGSLRGVIIHDLVFKVLQENNISSTFTYIFDDHDPMDSIPIYLNLAKWEKYAGMQLYKIPSPKPGYKSFAHYYAQEFTEVFNLLNCHPKIIWASELYLKGEMNELIKTSLDKAKIIRDILYQVTKKPKPADWHPLSVVCEKCQKIGTTYVYKWDGNYVYYRCLPKMVSWAAGCGYEGKISPFNGNSKLPWKIDWAAKWKILGVTIEGAGKDHYSSGGSWDVSSKISEKVFNYPPPFPIPYEHFTIGGRKMSSSKGLGASAYEISKILPPDILRFFIVRMPIESHIDFNPNPETIMKIYDDYDQSLMAYFDKLEGNIDPGKQGEIKLNLARIFELSQVNFKPTKRLFIPRFRTIYNMIKSNIDPLTKYPLKKLTTLEKQVLEERLNYAKKLFESNKIKQQTNKSLTSAQKLFLNKILEFLKSNQAEDELKIQESIKQIIVENNLPPKEVFEGFYLVLLGNPHGPKASRLILELSKEKVTKKISESLKNQI